MSGYKIPKDYIEVTDLKHLKQMLVYLLGEFHTICEEQHLIYNIFGGTMLGAVRHHGMIPWDDDIDVTMPRPDYEKFIQLIRIKYNDKFLIYDYPDENYCYPFAKFTIKDSVLFENMKDKYRKLGLYVDVFPIDGYPSVWEGAYFAKLKWYKYLRCHAVYLPRHTPGIMGKVSYLGKVLLSAISGVPRITYYLKKETALAKQNDFNDAEYVLCQGAGWCQKGKLKKDVYMNRKLYDFDGMKVWGIAEYNDHLKSLYGNYMTLPPENKRISNHDYVLFIKRNTFYEVIEGEGE